MPSKSPAQARLMAACAHGADYESCPPKKVAKDFNKADKGTGIMKKKINEEKKWKVTYDHYGSNREVPLYTKSHHVHAETSDEAISTIKKLVGGRNHRAEVAESSVKTFKGWVEIKEAMDFDPIVQKLAEKHGVAPDLITKQMNMGIKVEKEHTSDNAQARKIALDHLEEKPNYYTALSNMEAGECDK